MDEQRIRQLAMAVTLCKLIIEASRPATIEDTRKMLADALAKGKRNAAQ